MPHASLKVIPGVDQNKTPALNEAAISQSQLIRFIPDRQGLGLPQKLGGWTKYYPGSIGSTIRNMWAWADLNSTNYLAVGAEASLSTISNGALTTITPQTFTNSSSVHFETTEGSSFVTVTDSNGNSISSYTSVYIKTPVSVGGLVLFGTYQCQASSVNDYVIQARDTLGNPAPALWTTTSETITSGTGSGTTATMDFTGPYTFPTDSTITVEGVTPLGYNGTYLVTGSTTTSVSYGNVTTGSVTVFGAVSNFGAVPEFTTASGSSIVTVTLSNHGYTAGREFAVLVPVTVGGITLAVGNYVVLAAPSTFEFTIQALSLATSTASVFQNSGLAEFEYFVGIGPSPNSGAYGLGNYGEGPYGTSAQTVTSLSTSTGTVTLGFAGPYLFPVGAQITVAGMTPSGYNGTYTVTASTTTSVSYVNATTGAVTVYGTVTDAPGPTGTAITATDWTLDNYGSLLVAVPTGGPIYIYDPASGSSIATIIATGPAANSGAFVAMPERQIVAWGSTFSGVQDPLLIRYSDVADLTSWVGTTVNQAGSYRIPRGSKIVGAVQAQQQGLFWTDLALWAMQYVGPPLVYGFNEVGVGCGLIAPKAATVMSGVAYWMSQSQFFRYAGGGVEPILCPIWDVIFQDIDTTKLNEIRVAPNSRFNEVGWFYPTTDVNNPVKYAKYNIGLNTWDFGNLTRNAWINQSVLGPPIGAAGGLIYQHETSADADGTPMLSSFQTGYFALDEADIKTFVDQIWPDMKWGYYGGTQAATVNITFFATDYAGQTPTQYGPFPVTQSTTYVTPRMRGRLVSIKIDSSDLGSFWRLGNIRYRLQPDGRF